MSETLLGKNQSNTKEGTSYKTIGLNSSKKSIILKINKDQNYEGMVLD